MVSYYGMDTAFQMNWQHFLDFLDFLDFLSQVNITQAIMANMSMQHNAKASADWGVRKLFSLQNCQSGSQRKRQE
jgi:hypothetical protein